MKISLYKIENIIERMKLECNMNPTNHMLDIYEYDTPADKLSNAFNIWLSNLKSWENIIELKHQLIRLVKNTYAKSELNFMVATFESNNEQIEYLQSVTKCPTRLSNNGILTNLSKMSMDNVVASVNTSIFDQDLLDDMTAHKNKLVLENKLLEYAIVEKKHKTHIQLDDDQVDLLKKHLFL